MNQRVTDEDAAAQRAVRARHQLPAQIMHARPAVDHQLRHLDLAARGRAKRRRMLQGVGCGADDGSFSE